MTGKNGKMSMSEDTRDIYTVCDPPDGWRYGFPKQLDETVSYDEFLIANGYPVEDVPLAMTYSRFWQSSEYPE